jgi:hypothetical protein
LQRAGLDQRLFLGHTLPVARAPGQEAGPTDREAPGEIHISAGLSGTTWRHAHAATGEYLNGTGAQVLDEGLKIIAPETGQDVTSFHVNGANYVLEIAQIIGIRRAYLKSGSPSCDREGITGEVLSRNGIKVIRVG